MRKSAKNRRARTPVSHRCAGGPSRPPTAWRLRIRDISDTGQEEVASMGRAFILWLLGVPASVLVVLWLIGFFH
jgi:hypothetical protein